jgi:hypothetical protein
VSPNVLRSSSADPDKFDASTIVSKSKRSNLSFSEESDDEIPDSDVRQKPDNANHYIPNLKHRVWSILMVLAVLLVAA